MSFLLDPGDSLGTPSGTGPLGNPEGTGVTWSDPGAVEGSPSSSDDGTLGSGGTFPGGSTGGIEDGTGSR